MTVEGWEGRLADEEVAALSAAVVHFCFCVGERAIN